MRLAGKHALVAGGSRGIGRAIAKTLAAAGAAISIAYVRNSEAAASTIADIRSGGGNAFAFQADTSRRPDVERLTSLSVRAGGPIDIFVNSAAILSLPGFLDVTEDEWNRVLGVNLTGCFLAGQAVARHMIEHRTRGVIVNISSNGAFAPAIGETPYKVSKAGVEMLSRLMALELAPHGIRVNTVAPGLTETEMSAGLIADKEHLHHRLDLIPLRTLCKPDDIAEGVLYLATAPQVTGTTLRIDGGRAAIHR